LRLREVLIVASFVVPRSIFPRTDVQCRGDE